MRHITSVVVTLMVFGVDPVLAQDVSHCEQVLFYTGREQSVLKTFEMEEAYERHTSSLAAEAGYGPYSGNIDSSDESVEERKRRVEFFHQNDLVFGPAVQAWLSCVGAANESMAVKGKANDTGERLILEIEPMKGGANIIQGVTFPEDKLSCMPIGAEIPVELGPNMNLRFDEMRDLFIECNRKGDSRDQLNVNVYIVADPFSFALPLMAGDPVALDSGNRTNILPRATGHPCAASETISPVTYPRELLVSASMRGNFYSQSSVGELNVKINGSTVISGVEPWRDGWNPGGGFERENRVLIPAFTPAKLEAGGGIQGGTCTSMQIDVWAAR